MALSNMIRRVDFIYINRKYAGIRNSTERFRILWTIVPQNDKVFSKRHIILRYLLPYSFDVLNLLLIHKKINYSCVVIKDLQVCYRHEQFVWRMTVIIKLPCTDVHSSSYNVLLFKQSARHYSYIDCFVVEYGLMVVIFRNINPKSHREIVNHYLISKEICGYLDISKGTAI